jgi:hypothetical protein
MIKHSTHEPEEHGLSGIDALCIVEPHLVRTFERWAGEGGRRVSGVVPQLHRHHSLAMAEYRPWLISQSSGKGYRK